MHCNKAWLLLSGLALTLLTGHAQAAVNCSISYYCYKSMMPTQGEQERSRVINRNLLNRTPQGERRVQRPGSTRVAQNQAAQANRQAAQQAQQRAQQQRQAQQRAQQQRQAQQQAQQRAQQQRQAQQRAQQQRLAQQRAQQQAQQQRQAQQRYFNPVGAHRSGTIGEDPQGQPNNLMPYIARVAGGLYPHLTIFGDDYPTVDGTGVRDYIHVLDLAAGHVLALQAFMKQTVPGKLVVNLGTGKGYSVLEMVAAFREASGQNVPYEIAGRRSGDIATCFADPALAKRLLGWQAQYDLPDMCRDTWRWQQANPQGYGVSVAIC